MLIEQITEFELKRPGPPGRTCAPITDYVHDKAKISKANLRMDYPLLLKYCKRQCTYFHLPWPKYLQISTSKCKILKVCLT